MDNDLIYLIRCALLGKTPERERVRLMDMNALKQLSRKHRMTAFIAIALEPVEDTLDASTALFWKQEKEKAIRKCILMDTERAEHVRFFEEHGIWYIPLKGIIVKEYYPQYGMREMADNDILIDGHYREKVYDYMVSRGYEASAFSGVHNSYQKKPVYNFEFHIRLFLDSVLDGKLASYFENIKERAIKDVENSFGFHMAADDQYIYMTAHAFKHYENAGMGLKMLTDDYVLRRKEKLDFHLIDAVLSELGLYTFSSTIRSLGDKLFADEQSCRELSTEESEMLSYIIGSGAFGNLRNYVSNRINEYPKRPFQKIRYIFSRIFLPLDVVRRCFPAFAKYPILLPFLPFYRVIRTITMRKGRVKAELKAVREYSKKE